MNAQKKSRSENSKTVIAKKAIHKATPGDQIEISGTVDNDGVLIQGGGEGNEYNIQIIKTSEAKTESDVLRLLEIPVKIFEPETILIPEGPFWMGSKSSQNVPVYETPQHEVVLPAYRIGKYPVTNVQSEEFINQTKTLVMPSMGWDGQRVAVGKENYPVAGVTWYEALAYCQWLSDKTGRNYSLPNEAQWEKACCAGEKSFYPWGDEFDSKRCNHGNGECQTGE